MTTQPESLILRSVRRELERAGWHVLRNQQGLGCVKGVADLLAIRDGMVVMIEVKTQTGRQSDAQVDFERVWRRHGGTYIVARGVDDLAAAGMVDCLPLAACGAPAP